MTGEPSQTVAAQSQEGRAVVTDFMLLLVLARLFCFLAQAPRPCRSHGRQMLFRGIRERYIYLHTYMTR